MYLSPSLRLLYLVLTVLLHLLLAGALLLPAGQPVSEASDAVIGARAGSARGTAGDAPLTLTLAGGSFSVSMGSGKTSPVPGSAYGSPEPESIPAVPASGTVSALDSAPSSASASVFVAASNPDPGEASPEHPETTVSNDPGSAPATVLPPSGITPSASGAARLPVAEHGTGDEGAEPSPPASRTALPEPSSTLRSRSGKADGTPSSRNAVPASQSSRNSATVPPPSRSNAPVSSPAVRSGSRHVPAPPEPKERSAPRRPAAGSGMAPGGSGGNSASRRSASSGGGEPAGSGGSQTGASGDGAPGTGSPGSTGVLDLTAVRILSRPRLEYPPRARRFGHEGRVTLILQVGPRGHVSGVALESSSGHGELDSSAAAYAARFTFAPRISQGSPVPFRVRLPVLYRLR